jgi:hypothetical protein
MAIGRVEVRHPLDFAMSFLAHLGQGPQLGDFSLMGCCTLTAINPLERDCTSFASNTPVHFIDDLPGSSSHFHLLGLLVLMSQLICVFTLK